MDTLTRRRLLMLGPLAVAAGAGGAAAVLLLRMQEGRYDPHALPSILVGKRLPAFTLPGQPPSSGFSASEISAQGQPAVVNFFASWCVPCAQEAPALAALRNAGVRLWGIAYKDKPDATARFLDRYGDPYVRVARDEAGTVGIDFGLYGVPESFVVDGAGVVRWRLAGGLSTDSVRQDLLPRLRSLS
jgi:cytochrome c biogenesis protein CcmG, thiol:disulfide interchange protein DsbE